MAGSLAAEQAVLGSVLIDNAKIDKVHWLEKRDFATAAHMFIWDAVKSLWEQQNAIDIVTITEKLQERKLLEDCGGVLYLAELTEIPTAANCEHYAKIVRKHAVKRRADEIGKAISKAASEDYDTLDDLYSKIEYLAGSLRPEAQGDLVHMADAEDEYFDYLEKEDDLINTGFEKFDDWMGGLGRGWLYVLAARPSVGKTAKMLQMLKGIASQGKGQCLVWSQEMKRPALFNRMMAAPTQIPATKFRLKQLTPQEKAIAREVYQKEFATLPIKIADAKNVTVEEITAAARQAKREDGEIAAIFVDYLGIMDIPEVPGTTRQQQIGKVTKGLKRLAMELDCVVVLLAQMNREGKKSIEPSLEHLRESGDIEQDADVVEFLWVDPGDCKGDGAHVGAKIIQSTIAKGRDIGVNRFRYAFYGAYQYFVDAPKDEIYGY